MIYLVVQNFQYHSKIINGGSQSARNLILGLKNSSLDLTIISWRWKPDFQVFDFSSSIQFETREFGKYISIELPAIQTWKDRNIIALFQKILSQLPTQTGIFHLLEVKESLGCWLEALASTEFKVVVTALDYAWLCANSHLLTRTSQRCQGPQDEVSCLQCHYNHRDVMKKVALKLLLASTYFPSELKKIYPENISKIIEKTSRKRRITETRLTNLRPDFQQIDALIAPSQSLKHFFARNGLPVDKIFHVPYGTQPGTQIRRSDRPSDGIVFGFVGKLTFDKGLDILIEALSQVRSQTERNISLIVYAGNDRSGFGKQMTRKINALPWISQRQFNGRDTRSIDDAHRQIHFQVAPSRWTDNLPNAVLEGIERQTPIIAPKYGSFLEMVEEGVNGWLYPENTVGELKSLLDRIVSNPDRFARLPFDDSKTRLPQAEAEDIRQIYQKLLPSS